MTHHFGSAWDLPVGSVISGDGERATKTHSNHNPYPWTDGNGMERDNDWAHRAIADGAEVRLPKDGVTETFTLAAKHYDALDTAERGGIWHGHLRDLHRRRSSAWPRLGPDRPGIYQ